MEQLLALQKLQFDACSRGSESKAEMEELHEAIAAPILAHYERLVLRGKKGVAVVRNGVCGECHLRITRSKLVTLANSDEVQLCDNCGRYLYLPEGEFLGLGDAKPALPAAAKRSPRKATPHVA